MAIKCGHCKKTHQFVAEVRDCARWDGVKAEVLQPNAWQAAAGEARLELSLSHEPPAPPQPVQVAVTEGMWVSRTDNKAIFKVQRALPPKNHTYAKRLIVSPTGKVTFAYAPGGKRFIQDNCRKMTLDEAKDFGALYGTCCVCGRTLTNEESIEAGIGPICAGKGMWGE